MSKAEELSWPELLACLQAVPADEIAWQELYRRLEMLARHVLHGSRALGSEAPEDLAQQTLVKLLESSSRLRRIDPMATPEAYFQTALQNTARDLARRKILAVKALHYLAKEKPLILTATRTEDERLERVLAVISQLAPDQQELLRLRFWEDVPLGEMARRRRKSYSALAVELFRVLERLREQLRRVPNAKKSERL